MDTIYWISLLALVPIAYAIYRYFDVPKIRMSFGYNIIHCVINAPSGRPFTHTLNVVNQSGKDAIVERLEVLVEKHSDIKRIYGDWEFHNAVLNLRYREKFIKGKAFYYYERDIANQLNANDETGYLFRVPSFAGVSLNDLEIHVVLTVRFKEIRGLSEVLGIRPRSKKYKIRFHPEPK